MVIQIIGAGKKETQLREILQERGYTVRDGKPDILVLPLPFSTAEGNGSITLHDGEHLVYGIADNGTVKAAKRKGCVLHPILKDEAYNIRNTALSAEGAAFAAMSGTEGALNGSACLVIGNGLLGSALYRLLTGMGAHTVVAARRHTALGEMPLEQLAEALPKFDFVFNTVPFPVLTADTLRSASKSTLFLELASAPYGIDRQAAQELGLRYTLESAIPGRYCPKAAARNIADYLERSVLSHE